MKTTSSKIHDAYPIGMLCVLEKPFGNALIFQLAVVYEHYKIGEHHGVSLLLNDGSYDGFSEQCLEVFSVTPVRFVARCSDYKFTNVGKLCKDFENGRFKSAFCR